MNSFLESWLLLVDFICNYILHILYSPALVLFIRHVFMDLEDAFRLLSAWGTAIEKGRDSTASYAALMKLKSDNRALFTQAVLGAEAYQQHFIENPPEGVSEDDLSHPRQRMVRVQLLKQMIDLNYGEP